MCTALMCTDRSVCTIYINFSAVRPISESVLRLPSFSLGNASYVAYGHYLHSIISAYAVVSYAVSDATPNTGSSVTAPVKPLIARRRGSVRPCRIIWASLWSLASVLRVLKQSTRRILPVVSTVFAFLRSTRWLATASAVVLLG